MRNQRALGRTGVLGLGYTGRVAVRLLAERGEPAWAPRGREWRAPSPLPRPLDTAIVLFPPRDLDAQAVAAGLQEVERVVYCSSTSVYGDRAGGWVQDDTPIAPDTPWGRARAQAEEALRANGAVIVRSAGIVGPGRSLVQRLRDGGRVRVAGDLERPVNLIHVDDLVRILVAAAEHGEPGATYLAAIGDPIPWIRFAQAASDRAGVPLPPRTPVPDDPNLAAFYTSRRKCRPTRYADLGVTLTWPSHEAILSSF